MNINGKSLVALRPEVQADIDLLIATQKTGNSNSAVGERIMDQVIIQSLRDKNITAKEYWELGLKAG